MHKIELRLCFVIHMAERLDDSVPPEPLQILRGAMDDDRYMCLISQDGVTGTVKLMDRVLLEGEPAQAMSSVFLVAEAHGLSESHDDLTRCSARYREEIANTERTGVKVTVKSTGDMQLLN